MIKGEERVIKIRAELDTRQAKKEAQILQRKLERLQRQSSKTMASRRDNLVRGKRSYLQDKKEIREKIYMPEKTQNITTKIRSRLSELNIPKIEKIRSLKNAKYSGVYNTLSKPILPSANLENHIQNTRDRFMDIKKPLMDRVSGIKIKDKFSPIDDISHNFMKKIMDRVSGIKIKDSVIKLKDRFSSMNAGILKINRVIALVVGTFLMLNSVVGNVIQAFDEMIVKMAEVDKNLRLTSASRESFKNPEYLDEAIRKITDLSGMTKGQAGAQIGTIYSEFQASGENIKESDMTKLAELAFAYANTGSNEMTMDKAFERIQGLVSGRTSAREAGLLGYNKGGTVEQSLQNIEKLLKARSTYEAVMQGGTVSAIKTRGDNALINTFERMYERTPIQLRNNIASNTLYKESLLGTRDEKTQISFTKAFNTIGAIMDKITALTSPNETLTLFIETVMRTFDILAEFWIMIEPLVNIMLKVVNKVLELLQPLVAVLTRTGNLLSSLFGYMAGTASKNKITQVWDEYKTFFNNRLSGNFEGSKIEGMPVSPTPLPPSELVTPAPQKQKISYVNDMGVLVETTITINGKGKLDTDTKVVD